MLIATGQIADYLPHTSPMLLLESAKLHDNTRLSAYSNTHLNSPHPLHNDHGHLSIYTGIEYAAQAAALHIGLTITNTPPQ
ncbi:hotdog family protein [Piscirickettsia litoralis]|uniref:Uncharacterized protein n=1 Tax=Piscirickettsia litoralis TaxID=1891921 RepID=A0ABX3A2S9_9GAMM|nr:hypothetical protein [Piscirickettsia litoralis]ODN42753.1 hypothetical protein BGC07_07230 [Piscirickettsia litoralis]